MFSDTEYSFTLQETSFNVVFRATTGLCRVKIYPRITRTFVLLSAHVNDPEPKGHDYLSEAIGSKSGYGYANSRVVQISGNTDIEFCL